MFWVVIFLAALATWAYSYVNNITVLMTLSLLWDAVGMYLVAGLGLLLLIMLVSIFILGVNKRSLWRKIHTPWSSWWKGL